LARAAVDRLKSAETSGESQMGYFVEALTTLHAGDSTVRRIGEFKTLVDAVKASEQVIDAFLLRTMTTGMTAAVLYSHYEKSGEVPFIFSDDARTMNVRGFNHFNYARERCAALLARKK
jgi:hypothetical protein